MDFHETALKKGGDEGTGNHDVEEKEIFPDKWAVLNDRGYEGFQNGLKPIYPKDLQTEE